MFRERQTGRFGILTVAMLSLLAASACGGFWRQRAACEQAVLAYCEMSEHCGSEAAGSCRSARSSLITSCSFSVEDSTACVEAVNDVLADACTTVPTDIACPAEVITAPTGEGEGEGEGARDTRYRLCGDDDGCEAPLACSQPIADEPRFCSINCSAPGDCPTPSNGQDAVCVAGLFCASGCDSDQQCAEGMTCNANPACVP